MGPRWGRPQDRALSAAAIRRSAVGPTHGWLAGRRSEMRDCLLAGGDDYELCFTAPQAVRAEVADRAAAAGVDVTRIGMIRSGHGLSVLGENGEPVVLERNGFDHFA